MKRIIDLAHIEYSYGQSPTLKDLSFCVSRGDFFIIIGPNGSGKTTLVKMIAGILIPERGHIRIKESSIRDYSRKYLARTVAYVPQLIQTDFPFTVQAIVLMGRSPRLGLLGLESTKDIDLAMKAMTFTGVEHLAHRKLSQLSGGECQRVFIARAICQETEIMLLDEPTASLDLAHQGHVMDLMEKLRKEKATTIVMVSHDINLAAMYGNRVLLLKSGQVVSLGTPTDVITFKTLEDAYGCKLLVDESPLGGFPRITLVPDRFIENG